MKVKCGLATFLALALLVSMQTALAKGAISKVTISGPLLPQPLVITDQDTLDALSFSVLEDRSTITTDAPQLSVSEALLITRYFRDATGQDVPSDELLYYPSSGGYLYYVGMIGAASQDNFHWFRPSSAGEAALQALIFNDRAAKERLQAFSLWHRFAALLSADRAG